MVIDHHCDLLHALANGSELPQRCGPDQLIAGGVAHQIMAIYTASIPGSVQSGITQLDIYSSLPDRYPGLLELIKPGDSVTSKEVPLTVSLSIENASSFCGEEEPLETGLRRFEAICEKASRPRYLSLTWAGQNRFGGGNDSTLGLTADGLELLRYLDGRSIPVDFSHTSDALADGIINAVDREGLRIPFMASHSNFRSVRNHVRNLPDAIATEIIRREGIIGLNVIAHFVGTASDYIRHIEYGVERLGAEHALAFGCDFFETEAGDPNKNFFPEWGDASGVSQLLQRVGEYSAEIALKMSHQNSQRFYQEVAGW